MSTEGTCDKKVVRIFARVGHLAVTKDPCVSPADPSSTQRDINRTAALPQFYGLMGMGESTPTNNDAIRVYFPDESDRSTGIFLKVDKAYRRPDCKIINGKEAFRNSGASMRNGDIGVG